jgi:holo-[acyl-carrier protein] synthase
MPCVIVGVGVDIVEVARIRAAYRRFGERFARRILTTEEWVEFTAATRPERFLAMRFAAKEAASKALGTGFKRGVTPARIGVRHAPSGKPSLVFDAELDGLLRALKVDAGHVSLSDETEYAVGYVVLETRTE